MIFFTLVVCWGTSPANAFTSPHPVLYYDKGIAQIDNYNGDVYRLNKAYKDFTELIKRFPRSPLGYLGLSRFYIIQAYRFDDFYQMDLIREEAFPLGVKALELGPLLPEIHLNYSFLEDIFAKHRHNQELAQKYLKLLPDEPETYYTLGLYLLAQDDYEKSLESFRTAIDLNPETTLRAMIYKRLGYISLKHLGQIPEAIDYYGKALQLAPHDPVVHEYLGRAYLENNDYPSAIEELRSALKISENSTSEYYLLLAKGYQCRQLSKMKEAIIYLEKAAGFKERDSRLYYHLGSLYFDIKDYARAFQNFKRVIDLRPHDFYDAYYLAGRSAYSLGDDVSAVDYFRKYLQTNSTGKEAEWILEHIPNLSQK